MEGGLVGIDYRVAALKATNIDLIEENKELKDKLEKMEMHSIKLNLLVFGLKSDIAKKNLLLI